jgi:hypothetical protein
MHLPVTVYISNVFPWWTIERQKAILASAVPGWPSDVAVFEDDINTRQRRNREVDRLTDRSEMLRPTSRKEPDTIYLASLAVLAWEENDLRTVVETIMGRDGTIVVIDDGVTITKAVALPQIVKSWNIARRKSRIAGAQKKGARVSAERRKAITAQGIEKIRPYWGMPAEEWPTRKLREMAGTEIKPMAYNTIVSHIGIGRELAQKRFQAALKRKAKLQQVQVLEAEPA